MEKTIIEKSESKRQMEESLLSKTKSKQLSNVIDLDSLNKMVSIQQQKLLVHPKSLSSISQKITKFSNLNFEKILPLKLDQVKLVTTKVPYRCTMETYSTSLTTSSNDDFTSPLHKQPQLIRNNIRHFNTESDVSVVLKATSEDIRRIKQWFKQKLADNLNTNSSEKIEFNMSNKSNILLQKQQSIKSKNTSLVGNISMSKDSKRPSKKSPTYLRTLKKIVCQLLSGNDLLGLTLLNLVTIMLVVVIQHFRNYF